MVERLFVIGAQRSGSTLLARLLAMHPDIETARLRPEPKFFLDPGSDAVAPDDYDLAVFGSLPSTPIRVEKSTTYIERADAATRMHACFPDAHVVAVLRDPVDRALSNYRFSTMHGWESQSLATAMSAEGQRRSWPSDELSTSPYEYLRRGRYADLLEPWLDQFGERVHLLRHVEVTGPGAALQRLVATVGGQRFEWPAQPKIVNASQDTPVEGETEVRALLAAYYEPHNRALARRHDVDIRSWSGSWSR